MTTPGSAPGAPLSSEDGRRTGRPGAVRLSPARRVAAIVSVRREVPKVVATGVEPGARRSRHWTLYACAVVVGPIASVPFWIAANGFFGEGALGPVALIPAWLALGLPPAIGCFLGWRLPLVERSRDRVLLAVAAPLVLLGYPYLWVEAGNYLALLGLAVLYAIGPIVLGRFFRLVGAVVRNRAA